mmetsp:Transcript_25519/g.69252  ORF Transcript_25519/g.69252 Transcript_25519/m.69252 type:complete len:221 (-) Transcript_25519:1687-2349(-)
MGRPLAPLTPAPAPGTVLPTAAQITKPRIGCARAAGPARCNLSQPQSLPPRARPPALLTPAPTPGLVLLTAAHPQTRASHHTTAQTLLQCPTVPRPAWPGAWMLCLLHLLRLLVDKTSILQVALGAQLLVRCLLWRGCHILVGPSSASDPSLLPEVTLLLVPGVILLLVLEVALLLAPSLAPASAGILPLRTRHACPKRRTWRISLGTPLQGLCRCLLDW